MCMHVGFFQPFFFFRFFLFCSLFLLFVCFSSSLAFLTIYFSSRKKCVRVLRSGLSRFEFHFSKVFLAFSLSRGAAFVQILVIFCFAEMSGDLDRVVLLYMCMAFVLCSCVPDALQKYASYTSTYVNGRVRRGIRVWLLHFLFFLNSC